MIVHTIPLFVSPRDPGWGFSSGTFLSPLD